MAASLSTLVLPNCRDSLEFSHTSEIVEISRFPECVIRPSYYGTVADARQTIALVFNRCGDIAPIVYIADTPNMARFPKSSQFVDCGSGE
jgi:hypothetical protein